MSVPANRMVRKSRWYLALLPLWLASACSQPEGQLTQIIVAIDADDSVAANLTSVQVAIYDPEAVAMGGPIRPVASQPFVVNATKASSGTVTFPFSVGVQKAESQRFLLVVTGYAADAAVIEQKALASFVDGEVRGLGIYLASPCFEQVCGDIEASTWLLRTCSAQSGVCGQVAAQDTTPVRAGAELDAGLATRGVEGTMEAGSGGGMVGGSDGGVPPESGQTSACGSTPCQHGGICSQTAQGMSCDCTGTGYDGARCENDVDECASANLCASPDYPCVQTAPPGYTCLGQFADWPMPDVLPGSKAAPSYDTTMSGVVIDRVTGLSWQRTLPPTYTGCTGQYTGGQGQVGDACSWSEAKSYCNSLELGGMSDWRLPSKIELESIIAKESSFFQTTIDLIAFSGAPSRYFWTVSPVASSARAWSVDFSFGATVFQELSEASSVRCVRGSPSQPGTPAHRYMVDTTLNTVMDTRTGLVWERLVKPGAVGPNDAGKQCSEGFRLPTLKELLTIVDPTRVNPSIEPSFRGETEARDTPAEAFWSTPADSSAFLARCVDFAIGDSSIYLSDTCRVRCVR